MPTQVQSILRKAIRKRGDRLTILTFPSDNHYDMSLAETGHEFIGLTAPNAKPWSDSYPIPPNYRIIPTVDGQASLPLAADLDMIIAHDRGIHYSVGQHLAQEYQLPLVLVEHTLPPAEWSESRLYPLRQREGVVNVFTAHCQKKTWGFDEDYDSIVNYIGINAQVFSPSDDEVEREDHILWFGDNILHKDETFGFGMMRYITGFPMPMTKLRIVGDNPGISKPVHDVEDLVHAYRSAGVLLNTRPNDPLPTTVLEAMACGCPVVSLGVGDLPKLIKNGENGFVANNPDELRQFCMMVLNDKDLSTKLSINGRDFIRKQFGVTRFTKTWEEIFAKVLEE